MSKEPEPTEPLQVHVDWYVGRGYRVHRQTKGYAILVKRKNFFRMMWHLFWYVNVSLIKFTDRLDTMRYPPGYPQLDLNDALVLEIKGRKSGDVVKADRDVVFKE